MNNELNNIDPLLSIEDYGNAGSSGDLVEGSIHFSKLSASSNLILLPVTAVSSLEK